MSFFYILTVFVVFAHFFVGFYLFVFDFHKIVIGKSTFIGYNVKKNFLSFLRFWRKITTKSCFFAFLYTFYTKAKEFLCQLRLIH